MTKDVSLKPDGSVKLSDRFRKRLNYRLKKQLEKYGMDLDLKNTSTEAKTIMLGLTLLWDSHKSRVKLKEPDICPVCGINTYNLTTHMRGPCGRGEHKEA